MSVTAAAASAVSNRAGNAMNSPGGLLGVLGGNANLAMQLGQKARARKAARRAARRARGGAVGSVTGALAGGDNGRLDTIESRLDALEGGTEGDVTQPSPTVNVPSTPEEGIAAAPAMPEPTMSAAEKMFGGGDMRQIAMGAGKYKK